MTYPFKYVPIGTKSEYSWIYGETNTISNPNYPTGGYSLLPGQIGYDVTKAYPLLPINLDIWNGLNIINPARVGRTRLRYAAFKESVQ